MFIKTSKGELWRAFAPFISSNRQDQKKKGSLSEMKYTLQGRTYTLQQLSDEAYCWHTSGSQKYLKYDTSFYSIVLLATEMFNFKLASEILRNHIKEYP